MKLGLIGAGNMASALARGIGEPVLVHDVDEAKARALAEELGGEAIGSNAELAERADVLVLCHKPGQLGGGRAARSTGARRSVVSILAATSTEPDRGRLPGGVHPSLHSQHPDRGAKGCAGLCGGSASGSGPEDEILELMGRTGTVIRLDDEPLIEPAMALMACGPGFMALVAEEFADGRRRARPRPG